MRRREITARSDWHQRVEAQGLLFHTNADGSAYWDETACYELSMAKILELEQAANELHAMFLTACKVAITHKRLGELGIPERLHEAIHKSWRYDDWEIFGRFDFTHDAKGTPKLLEYNADTPSGLLEASVIQWYWKEDCRPNADQFNSMHEALVARWSELLRKDQVRKRYKLHLTCAPGHTEDRMTVGYMGETAEQAGLSTRFISIDQIGWNEDAEHFVDLQDETIHQLFKLYPWEWMAEENFGHHLATQTWQVLEPPWKAVCSCKSLLFLLQELFPNHPNLLRVSRDSGAFPAYVQKPIWGREGSNVKFITDGQVITQTEGPYETVPSIYQEYCPLVQHNGYYAQLGVWMVSTEARGLAVREDVNPILRNTSRFIPHIIV